MENPMFLILAFVSNFLLSIIVGGIVFKISFQSKKHLLFGLVGGLSVYIIRSLFLVLGLPIGISTLVNLGFAIVIFKYVFKLEGWKQPIVSATLIYIITIINEILTLQPTLNLLKTDVQSVLNNTTLHFEVGMIQNIGLLMIMLIVYIVKKYIVDRRDVFIDN